MPDVINNATAYGVRVVTTEVAPGAEYWKVVRVYHLSPEENGGKHHIYLDAIDGQGQRLFNTQVLVRWDGGSQQVVIDKPLPEPGANFPMWKWQVCSVEALGLASDRVENLRTDHPDEAPGNTLFHHSFQVTFQRTQARPAGPPTDSVIGGRVPGGAGHTLALQGDGPAAGSTVRVGADERYRFAGLAAGRYTVLNQDDGRQVGPVEVDGENSVDLDFPPRLETVRPLAHYLLFGPSDRAATRLHLSLLADHISAEGLAFGFRLEEARQASKVTLVGEHAPNVRGLLEAAGCEVDTLPADPGALLAALSN